METHEDSVLSERSQIKKGHTLYDPIYIKYPEEANPQRQEVGQWSPGLATGGKRIDCLRETGFFLLGC